MTEVIKQLFEVTIQSRTPSDPHRGPHPSKRETFGACIRLIGSLPEGAGIPVVVIKGMAAGIYCPLESRGAVLLTHIPLSDMLLRK